MKTSGKSFSSLQHFSLVFPHNSGTLQWFQAHMTPGQDHLHQDHALLLWRLKICIRPHGFQGPHPQGLVLKCGSGDIHNRERDCSNTYSSPGFCPRQKQNVFKNSVPIHYIKNKCFSHMKLVTNRYQEMQWEMYRERGREEGRHCHRHSDEGARCRRNSAVT